MPPLLKRGESAQWTGGYTMDFRTAHTRAVWLVVSAALVLTFGLLAGCGGSSTSATTSGGTVTTLGPGTTLAPGTTAAPGTTGGSTATSAAGNAVQVVMTNRSYDPQQVTIKVGDTITWVNQDAPKHDVVADNGEFKSDLFDKGGTFSFTFLKAGTYPYHCSIHPGMVGTVVVH
jgi:plastocyanin